MTKKNITWQPAVASKLNREKIFPIPLRISANLANLPLSSLWWLTVLRLTWRWRWGKWVIPSGIHWLSGWSVLIISRLAFAHVPSTLENYVTYLSDLEPCAGPELLHPLTRSYSHFTTTIYNSCVRFDLAVLRCSKVEIPGRWVLSLGVVFRVTASWAFFLYANQYKREIIMCPLTW